MHGDLIIEDLAFMTVKMPSPGSDLAARKFFLPGWLKVEAESGQIGTPEEIDLQRYAVRRRIGTDGDSLMVQGRGNTEAHRTGGAASRPGKLVQGIPERRAIRLTMEGTDR